MKKKWNKRTVILWMLMLLMISLTVGIIVISGKLKPYEEQSASAKTTYHLSGVEIQLPETYYVASGLNAEIYNKQISNLGAHISEYTVQWDTDYTGARAEADRLVISAGDDNLGEFSVKVSIYDGNQMLAAEKEFTVEITESKQKQFSLLAIGDSLSADGALYRRLQELLGNQLICNGTRGYEGYLTEARLGFSAKDYLTETGYDLEEGEEVHRFWNPETERFDWNYYKASTGFSPDVILLHLGTNGLLSGDENAENICKIVELIRQDDKQIPIYVVNTIYQSDQNGIGSMKMNNGSLMFSGQYKQQRDLANFKLRSYLTEQLINMDKVYLVPASISVDSASVFEMEARAVNPYSEETETVATDAVHPAEDGYRQLAEVIYSTWCATIEEW